MLSASSAIAWLGPATAEVTSSLDHREFVVSGDTASELVSFMNRHPIQGDHGHAYASIHPSYRLQLTTRTEAGLCRPQIDVDVHFTLTLPTASTGGMTRSTRVAWTGFVNFARAHEEHHRQSYLGCAKAFATAAGKMTGKQCLTLNTDIRKMFAQMKRDCEVKQRAFDRSQARLLAGSALFSMARNHRH